MKGEEILAIVTWRLPTRMSMAIPINLELPQHEAGVDTSATMGECAVHLHWVLLGFDFSLPASPDTHDPDHLVSCESVMVRLVDDLPTISQVEQRCVAADLPVSPDLVVPRCLSDAVTIAVD